MVSDSEDVDIYLAAHHPSSVIWDRDMKKKRAVAAGAEVKKKGWLAVH